MVDEHRTTEQVVPSPYDGKWCHENYSEASALINTLHRETSEAKAGWEETSWRCDVLLDALKKIEKLPRDQTGHSLMRAREIAREAIAWCPPPEENT